MIIVDSIISRFTQVFFIADLQADLNTWIKQYNEERVHNGKYCFGKTPMQTFLDSIPLVKEKMLNNNLQATVARLSN